MHINDKKFSFDIFMVENVLNIFMEHGLNILMIFGIKEKSIILCYMLKCMIVSMSFIQSTLQSECQQASKP